MEKDSPRLECRFDPWFSKRIAIDELRPFAMHGSSLSPRCAFDSPHLFIRFEQISLRDAAGHRVARVPMSGFLLEWTGTPFSIVWALMSRLRLKH